MTALKSPTTRRRNGFTLIEVIAILVLLGVLVAGVRSVLPASNVALAAEVDRLGSHITYAQVQAQTDIYQWRLIFTDASTYELGPIILPGAGFTPRPIPGGAPTQGVLADGVTTTAGTVIRFDSWGRPMDDNGNLLSAHQTITLTQGGQSLSLTILAETGLVQ